MKRFLSYPFLSLLILSFGIWLAGSAVNRESVTFDEFQSLPTGLAILKTGNFNFSCGTPPLSQVLPAIPLLFTSASLSLEDLPARDSCWNVGVRFIEENANRYHQLFMIGRYISLLVLLVTFVAAWGISRKWYGSRGAALTAFVLAFCPNLLAHGALLTPDIYTTAALIFLIWALDLFLVCPGFGNASALGVAIGVFNLAKYTGVIALPLVLVAALSVSFYNLHQGKVTRWKSYAVFGAWSLGVAIFTINAGYLFSGTGLPVAYYHFQSPLLARIQSFLPSHFPVLLPFAFIDGFDMQLTDTGFTSYLLGVLNHEGFLSYYAVAFLVKTPIAILFLWGFSTWKGKKLERSEILLIAIALFLFGFFSWQKHKNIGIRYLLFLYPIGAIWVGRLGPSLVRKSVRVLAIAAVLVLAVENLMSWPNYISFFNVASGGPANGHRYLLDSNLDWGQDLLTLKSYMSEHKIDAVDLAYFGRVAPQVYGIDFNRIDYGNPPANRYVAISANYLFGYGLLHEEKAPEGCTAFRNKKPLARLGSIYLFDRLAF